MNTDEKFNLIKRNTAEIISEEELKNLLSAKKNPKVYWGRATTGPLHMGHTTTLSKLFDMQKAGVKTVILLADIHAALDDLKSPWEETEKRVKYTKKAIELVLPWEETPEFIVGSSFQLEKKYVMDVLKLSTMTTVSRATRAASEVTRMENPKVSELIYPIMQALDEEYLGVDIQLGGLDQRHIMALAREYLPKLGYKSRIEIMRPLITSLKGPGVKMSSSIAGSHIKVHDSEEQIKKCIKDAYCPEGDSAGNPVLELCNYLILPIKGKMKIERAVKFGGDVVFENYAELERAFKEKKLHPMDLKNAVSNELIQIFSKARKYFEAHHDILEELGTKFL